MAFARYSINCRLLVVQVVLAILILYLNNVAHEMRQYRQQTNSIVQNLDGQHPQKSKSVIGNPTAALVPDAVNKNAEAVNFEIDAFNGGKLQNEAVDERPQKLEIEPNSAFNLSANNKFQQDGLLRCPMFRRPTNQQMDISEPWLKLQQQENTATIYVYSTVFREATDDQRSAENVHRLDERERRSTRVRLFVMSTVLETSSRVYCLLWYSDVEQPTVVRGAVDYHLYRADEENSGVFPLNVYAVVCKEPSTIDHQAMLQHVTLTVDSKCPDDANRAFLPIFRPEPAVISGSAEERANTLVVCMAPAPKERLEKWSSLYNSRNELQSPWFVEWMELMSLFGAHEVILYTTFHLNDSISFSTRRLLDYYSNRKSGLRFVVRPLLPPLEYMSNGRRNTDNHNSHPELTGVAFNDCLLRFSHNPRVSHVAPSVGADEILVPRQISLNYTAMLSRMDPAKRSLVLLRGATFSTDENKAVEDSFLRTVRFRSRDRMTQIDRHVVNPQRCLLLSSTGTCTQLAPDGAAPNENDIFMSPPAFGAWHRYRPCAEDEKKQCAIDLDNALMRFQKQLKLNVVQVIKDSGLITNEEDLHQIALRL